VLQGVPPAPIVRDILRAGGLMPYRRRQDKNGRLTRIKGRTIPMKTLLPTALVGSYSQPEWLIDRKKLAGRFPPRVRAKELWRVAPEFLEQAQDDATILAIRDQERAGLDIITDGEMRRESYSNRFATALDGVDIDSPGTALDRSGHPNPVPRVVGPIRRRHPVEVRDVQFLRANTDRMIKMTVPGPFTMSQQAQDDYYKDPENLALDYAAAVNAEIKDLFAAGADIVQVDEPYMQARPEKARQYGLKALNRALEDITGTSAVHICFGYAAIIHERPLGYSFLPELEQSAAQQVSIETAQSSLDTSVLKELPSKTIILGVLDLSDMTVETPEAVAARIRRALPYVPADRIIVAPDCGLKYLPRDVAFGKMKAMVEGARIVRKELADKQAAD
jgi:5-methyltetrahydropteroyltriglutamate--homocysteine methyltransferase